MATKTKKKEGAPAGPPPMPPGMQGETRGTWTMGEAGFSTLPEGSYVGTIVKAEQGMSKQNQPKVDLEIEVDHEGEKKKLFTSLSLQSHAMFKMRELLDALGYTKAGQGTIKFEPHYRGDHIIDFEGKTVGVIVAEVTYEGKVRNQVDNFFNAEESESDAPWNPGTAKEM